MLERTPHDRSQCPRSRGRRHRRRDGGEDGGQSATRKRPRRQQRARREDAGPWPPAGRTGRGAPSAPRCPRRSLGSRRPLRFRLITLKAPHLESALGPLVERDLARTFVSLGNGLVQDRIAAIVGDENLVVGTVEWGATNLGAGHLAQTTRAPFVIGEPEGDTKERTRLLAEVLETVANVRITENISGQVWSKLL